MLLLNDPRWRELQHAYGDASDVPQLLQALATSTAPIANYEAEPWFSLWSCLCHQGEVYTASYAAVPHIVHIASRAKGTIHCSFLTLPTAIEIARKTRQGPDIPAAYAESYHHAISQLIEVVFLHRSEEWDQKMLLVAAAAQAVAKGHVLLADALLNLTDDLIARVASGELE